MTKQKERPLSLQLAAMTLARLGLNTGLRMVYPFAPALARGLGVEVTAVYQLISIRNFAGFLSPLFGPLSERYGRKSVMLGALAFFVVACLLVVIRPLYGLLGVTLAGIALAKVIYDPAMQAHVGDAVPYAKRGRAISITEISWAGALLVGAPLVGWAIDRGGWQAPFWGLAIVGVAAILLLWRIIPNLLPSSDGAVTLRQLVGVVRRHPVIWAAAVHVFLLMLANEIFFIIYGDWMERSFDLALTSLGLASGVIGGAEISGELLAGGLVDRFGKRRVVIVAGILNAATYALMPVVGRTLVLALAALVVLFIFFEITVVGGVPLLTEIVPSARSVAMSMVLGAGSLGRAVGALAGPTIEQVGGFTANGLAAAVIALLAIVVLVFGIREAA